MIFRYARHTNDLSKIKEFYHEFLGLDQIGEFNDHEGYDGLFFGKKDLDWHLEFTSTNEIVHQKPNPDDLLVFYLKSKEEIEELRKKAVEMNFEIATSQNPYWQRNGIEIKDPDGFGIIVTIRKL